MEKPDQVLDIRLVRADADTIDVNRSQHIVKPAESLRAGIAILVSKSSTGGIDEKNLTSLRVGKLDQPDAGQCHLGAVADRDGNDVMTFV